MRKATPILLAGFFAFATAMCLLAGVTLLVPGAPAERLWSIKANEYHRLLQMGPGVAAGFLLLALVMVLAAYGSARRRLWGWRLALAIFALNGFADALRIPFGAAAEGAIGVAATVAILWWLSRPGVRALFDRRGRPHRGGAGT